MKWATILVVIIGAAAAVTIYWAVGTLQRPASPVSAAEQPEPALPAQPSPLRHVGPLPSIEQPLPEELEAAVAAAMAAPPEVHANPRAPLPFPRLDQIPVGTEKEEILKTYREPTVRALTNVHGDMLETYVYSSGSNRDTWIVLRNGSVAAKFSTPHIPRQP